MGRKKGHTEKMVLPLDISTEIPEYEQTDVDKEISDLLTMFKNIIRNQKADLALMERYIKKLENNLK